MAAAKSIREVFEANDRLARVALALMAAEGWRYEGKSITSDPAPRAQHYVTLAAVAIDAADRKDR